MFGNGGNYPVGAVNVSNAGGAQTLDLSAGNLGFCNGLGANLILTVSNMKEGVPFYLRITQDAVGGWTLTITNSQTTGSLTLTPTAAALASTFYTFMFDGSRIYLMAKG